MYTAVLMLALTTAADTADHGRRGGGCSGGYGGCSGYYGGGYGGCYGGGYGGYGGCSGYYGGGGGYGCCGGGGYYGGGYRTGYGGGGYYPGYAYMNTGYYSPNVIVQGQGTEVRQSYYQGADQNVAMVQVLLPNPDAEVWFDGTPTTQRGTDRFFQSPALQGDGRYQYTIKARWNRDGKNVEQERRVDVTPGRPVMVDFRAPSGEPIGDPNRQNPNSTVNPNTNPNPNPPNPNPTKKNEN